MGHVVGSAVQGWALLGKNRLAKEKEIARARPDSFAKAQLGQFSADPEPPSTHSTCKAIPTSVHLLDQPGHKTLTLPYKETPYPPPSSSLCVGSRDTSPSLTCPPIRLFPQIPRYHVPKHRQRCRRQRKARRIRRRKGRRPQHRL